ncbi:MAG: hypothetical protein ABSF29_14005 [Tepidisphaeraceae bacterium]
MNRWAAIFGLGFLILQGCGDGEETVSVTEAPAPAALAPIPNEVVARIRGNPITMEDIQPVLVEGYGLNVVLLLVQRELAREEAAKQFGVGFGDDAAVG